MAYSEKQINDIFKLICTRIAFGESLRGVLKDKEMPSNETFYKWIDNDEEKTKQYARACSDRAEMIFEDILTIADDDSDDEKDFVGINHIHRDKLKIDARKWILAKMMPSKYGDKLEIESTINDKRKTIADLFPEIDETED